MHNENIFEQIPIPENIDDVIDQGIAKAIKIKKSKRKKKFITTTASIAAAAAVFSLFCVSNPVLAAKIPFIGHIFERVETTVSYKGDFSSSAQVLVTEGAVEKASESGSSKEMDTNLQSGNEGRYVQTSNGITITVSQVNYSTQALYLAMSIKSEEEFPADFMKMKNMEGYLLDYDTLMLDGEANFSFSDDDFGTELYIEGQFMDNHTFAGIYRVPLERFAYYPTEEEIAAKGIKSDDYFTDDMEADEAAPKVDEYNLKLKEVFPDIGKLIQIPDKFTYSLNISNIFQDLFETIDKTVTFPEGDTKVVQENLVKEYEGEWNFQFDVSLDTSKTQTIELNDINKDGVGISTVEKTPYEITAKRIIPSDKLDYDYFLVMLDKNGELMNHQGSSSDTYQLYGRDTSTVYIYLCDYIQYMDEIKGYYWSDDYEEKKKTKTFQQYLDEKALYRTEVSFTE